MSRPALPVPHVPPRGSGRSGLIVPWGRPSWASQSTARRKARAARRALRTGVLVPASSEWCPLSSAFRHRGGESAAASLPALFLSFPRAVAEGPAGGRALSAAGPGSRLAAGAPQRGR